MAVAREVSTSIHEQGCWGYAGERVATSEEAPAPPHGRCEPRYDLSGLAKLSSSNSLQYIESFMSVCSTLDLCCCSGVTVLDSQSAFGGQRHAPGT